MKSSRLRRLILKFIEKIYATEAEEISCSDCFEATSAYVDAEIAGEAVARKMPLVKQHLDQCQVCYEEYQLLRQLAQLEAEGRSTTGDQTE